MTSRVIEFETTIKRGLPVIAQVRLYPSEPDVGMGPSAELEDVMWMTGRSLPPDFDIPGPDLDRIEREALDKDDGCW
jgi:hypothetical protein